MRGEVAPFFGRVARASPRAPPSPAAEVDVIFRFWDHPPPTSPPSSFLHNPQPKQEERVSALPRDARYIRLPSSKLARTLPCSSESSLGQASPVYSHLHISRTPAGCRPETARALASNPTIPTHISSQKSRRDGHFCCSRNRYLSDEGGGLRPALLQALAPITLGHQRPSVSDTASSPPALTPLLVQLQSSSSNPTHLSL